MSPGGQDDEKQILRFVNGRFEQEGVHLDGVAELAKYQRVVRAIAQDLWLERTGHSMPTRYLKYFELRLLKMTEGSFKATIAREDEELQTEDVLAVQEMTEERVDELFGSIVHGMRPSFNLSHESEIAIGKFGSSFEGDEGLIVSAAGSERRYGREQHDLVRAILRDETISRNGTLIGKIFALNTNSKTFQFELPSGEDVSGSYQDEDRWEDIRQIIDLPASRTLIRLSCSYEEDGQKRLLKITDVEEVEVFSHENDSWTETFTALASLQPGWLDSYGDRIDFAAIEMSRDILRLLPDGPFRPALFPTPAGGVQIEWLTETQHIQLAISTNLLIEAHAYDASNRQSLDAVPFDAEEAADFVMGALRA